MYFLGLLLEFLAFFIKGCQMVVKKEPQNLYIRRRCGFKCTPYKNRKNDTLLISHQSVYNYLNQSFKTETLDSCYKSTRLLGLNKK